jgi:hypothetical protein
MTNQILKFGKFKGVHFNNTPVWYQNYLKKQDWFMKKPVENISTQAKKLNGWDGHSKKGQANYDRLFEMEMQEAHQESESRGKCYCCELDKEDCRYIGM